jgi:hypothetical protein
MTVLQEIDKESGYYYGKYRYKDGKKYWWSHFYSPVIDLARRAFSITYGRYFQKFLILQNS